MALTHRVPSAFRVLPSIGNIQSANNAFTTITIPSFSVTGSDRLLVVLYTAGSSFGGTTIAATYGGVSMTKLSEATRSSATGYVAGSFYLLNPTLGSADVVISGFGSSTTYRGTAILINGVTSTPTGATSLSLSITATPASTPCLVIDAVCNQNSITAGSGQTQIWAASLNGNHRGSVKWFASGDATVTWTGTASNPNYVMMMIPTPTMAITPTTFAIPTAFRS